MLSMHYTKMANLLSNTNQRTPRAMKWPGLSILMFFAARNCLESDLLLAMKIMQSNLPHGVHLQLGYDVDFIASYVLSWMEATLDGLPCSASGTAPTGVPAFGNFQVQKPLH